MLVPKSGVFALVDAADAADRTLASGTAAGVDPERGEAKVALTLHAGTGAIEASAEGVASKLGIGPDGGGPVGWWGDLAANGLDNDELGADPLVALAYLDAYIKLVKQMEGDLPATPEAPQTLPSQH